MSEKVLSKKDLDPIIKILNKYFGDKVNSNLIIKESLNSKVAIIDNIFLLKNNEEVDVNLINNALITSCLKDVKAILTLMSKTNNRKEKFLLLEIWKLQN